MGKKGKREFVQVLRLMEVCKFACNNDPLKGLFASNTDPL
jgi:hypothetical protein